MDANLLTPSEMTKTSKELLSFPGDARAVVAFREEINISQVKERKRQNSMLPPSAGGVSWASGDSEGEAARVREVMEAGEEGSIWYNRDWKCTLARSQVPRSQSHLQRQVLPI